MHNYVLANTIQVMIQYTHSSHTPYKHTPASLLICHTYTWQLVWLPTRCIFIFQTPIHALTFCPSSPADLRLVCHTCKQEQAEPVLDEYTPTSIKIFLKSNIILVLKDYILLASFPDSTPQLFIALCIKADTQCDKKLGSGVWERG